MSEHAIPHDHILETIASDDFPFDLLPDVLSAVAARLSSVDRDEPLQARREIESSVLAAITSAGDAGVSRRYLIHNCWGYRSLANSDRDSLVLKLMSGHGVSEVARRSEETGRLSRVLVAGSCSSRNDEVMRNDEGCSHHFNASNDADSGEMLR